MIPTERIPCFGIDDLEEMTMLRKTTSTVPQMRIMRNNTFVRIPVLSKCLSCCHNNTVNKNVISILAHL